MRPPATGIGYCKTKFHLPGGKAMAARIRRFILFRSIRCRVIKVLASGVHTHGINT